MPTPPEIAKQTNLGASLSSNAPSMPNAEPDSGQVAEGGRWPGQEDLPSTNTDPAPATYGGFRPSDYTHPLPSEGE